MNESDQPILPPASAATADAKASLQEGRQAFTAEVVAHNTADASRLGSIAAGHEVHTTSSGVVLTPREVEAAAHGSLNEK
jgi:hypothetical protein